MAYTKNYYLVLGLDTPSSTTTTTTTTNQSISPNDIRTAYKSALLAAHPDSVLKRGLHTNEDTRGKEYTKQWTVDDIKEAYAILGDVDRRRDFDKWLVSNKDGWGRAGQGEGGGLKNTLGPDFILGLEVLDLEDFTVVDPLPASSPPSPSEHEHEHACSDADRFQDADDEMEIGNGKEAEMEEGGVEEESTGMQWTRPCRCGADTGFRITEEELEEASRRGEKEVLVGCEGCSLWVRVGFEVVVDG
jgi:diphthamide biosynthesis protein 4